MSWKEHLRPAVFDLSLYSPFDYATAPKDLVRLDANEAAYPLDADELSAFQRELGKVAFHRYPEVSARPLREALARRWGVRPEQLLLGNGSDEIISILLTAFGGGRDGRPARVVYPTPTFGEYEAIALAHGAVPLPVPLDARFQLDEPALLEAIRRERPALAFYASPNNPTGNRFDAAAMERLARAMEGVAVVDEAYGDFGGATQLGRVGEVPGLFVMRTLSKVGLAALRLGALVGPAEAIAELHKVRLPYNVNSVTIALACAALDHPGALDARIRRVAERRRELEAGLRALPRLTVFPSDSNFVLVRVPGAKAVFEGLLARGVIVRNLSRPGPLQDCLRITAGTPEENEACLRALRAVLA